MKPLLKRVWHQAISYLDDLVTPEPLIVVPVALKIVSTMLPTETDVEREIFQGLLKEEG